MEEEEWRRCEEWPDYDVSSFGRVYNSVRNRLLKVSINKGYPCVNVSRDGRWKLVVVHRLVALAFVSGYFDGAVVNHKDGVKTNNHPTNLEWLTHGDTVRYIHSTGVIPGRGKEISRIISRSTPEDRARDKM